MIYIKIIDKKKSLVGRCYFDKIMIYCFTKNIGSRVTKSANSWHELVGNTLCIVKYLSATSHLKICLINLSPEDFTFLQCKKC